MDDAVVVGGLAPSASDRTSAAASRGGQRPAPQPLRQRAALAQLHREVRLPVVGAALEDLHDVGVVQPGDRLGLGQEAGACLGAWKPPARTIFSATRRPRLTCRAL